MESPFKLTPAVTEGMVHLFTAYPPMAYRDTVIDIYLGYLSHEHGHLPANFDSMGHQMYLLLDFLRIVAQESDGNRKESGWEK